MGEADMLKAGPESYTACEPELQAIYPQHWAELAVDPDIPLEPDYEVYRALDAGNKIAFVTLRDEYSRLAGYFIGFIWRELHYKSCVACFTDIFYVLPEFRKGWSGVKLFRAVEAELRRRDVQRWYVTSKLHKDSSALLRRCGFAATESHFSKRLK
jgi:GNAT superfamily N-acetyltransferase